MVEKIQLKMLDSNVNYKINMKTSYYLIELLLVFRNSVSFARTLRRPKAVISIKALILLKIVV